MHIDIPHLLLHFLEQLQVFTPGEAEQLAGMFKLRHLEKDEYFVREGMSCTEIAFIASGIFRSFYRDEQGLETTYCFRFPGMFLAAYSSFITGTPSIEYMQAISPAQIWTISASLVEQKARAEQKWTQLLRFIAEQEFLEMERRLMQLQRDPAVKRYNTLLQEQPEYLQQIPLQYLASYLGISQRHLSRIRKEIML